MNTASADDTLTKKAEEQANRVRKNIYRIKSFKALKRIVSKIATEFCSWLRQLPAGEDDTVNTLPEEQVRALFDTAQAASPATSKLAEGLQSWAKFGASLARSGSVGEIARVANEQVTSR